MAERIALEIVIEIGVGVEMQDRNRPALGRDSGQDRIGHHMVAAEEKGNDSVSHGLGSSHLRVTVGTRQENDLFLEVFKRAIEPGAIAPPTAPMAAA